MSRSVRIHGDQGCGLPKTLVRTADLLDRVTSYICPVPYISATSADGASLRYSPRTCPVIVCTTTHQAAACRCLLLPPCQLRR